MTHLNKNATKEITTSFFTNYITTKIGKFGNMEFVNYNKHIMKYFIILSTFFSVRLFGQDLTDPTDHIAEYPGGLKAIEKTISSNLIYPKSAQKDNITGKCIIKFVVDTLGEPTNIIVQKSLRGDCDTAAINAVKHLHGWKPGQLMKKKVPVTLTLPINFEPLKKN